MNSIILRNASAARVSTCKNSIVNIAQLVPIRMNSNMASNRPSFPFSRPGNTYEPAKEFEYFRKNEPITKVKMWDGSECWLLTRHFDVMRVLMDDIHFSKSRTHPNYPELGPGGKLAAQASAHRPTFVDMDHPAHTKQRGMVEPSFNLAAMDSLTPLIHKTIDECIEKFITTAKAANGKPINFIEEFSLRVPTIVIYNILGIPLKDMEFLDRCNAVRTNGSSTSGEAAEANKELLTYLSNLVKAKRSNPQNDFTSKLITDYEKKGTLEHDDVVQVVFLMLVAGNATMVNMLNLGLVTLLRNAEQLAGLKQNPKLWGNAVEEILRYHTASALATRRVCVKDVRVGDVIMKSGDGVIASNQSANRDETVFKNPNQFDIYRAPNPHLAFGFGPHQCVAEWLCREELVPTFRTLFERCPNIKVAVPYEQIKFTPAAMDVGIIELPVTI